MSLWYDSPIMADVTTIDTHVQAHPLQVAIRVEIPNQELRAAEAAEVLLCLSELAGLIAGSDYVELAEADPAEAERWKSLSLVVHQMSIVNLWEVRAALPGCTPERVQAFVEALTSIYMVVRDRHGDKKNEEDEKRELEEQRIEQAARLLVAHSTDVPRTPPVENVREIVVRLALLSVKIVDVTVHRG